MLIKKKNLYSVEKMEINIYKVTFSDFSGKHNIDWHIIIIGVFASLIRRSQILTFVKLTQTYDVKLLCVTSIKTFILQFKIPFNIKQ